MYTGLKKQDFYFWTTKCKYLFNFIEMSLRQPIFLPVEKDWTKILHGSQARATVKKHGKFKKYQEVNILKMRSCGNLAPKWWMVISTTFAVTYKLGTGLQKILGQHQCHSWVLKKTHMQVFRHDTEINMYIKRKTQGATKNRFLETNT